MPLQGNPFQVEGRYLDLLIGLNSVVIEVLLYLINAFSGIISIEPWKSQLEMLKLVSFIGFDLSPEANRLISWWRGCGLGATLKAWGSVSTICIATLSWSKLDSWRARISLTSLRNSAFILLWVSMAANLALIPNWWLKFPRTIERRKGKKK